MRPIQREDGVHGRNGDEATDRSVSVRAGDITIGNENVRSSVSKTFAAIGKNPPLRLLMTTGCHTCTVAGKQMKGAHPQARGRITRAALPHSA